MIWVSCSVHVISTCVRRVFVYILITHKSTSQLYEVIYKKRLKLPLIGAVGNVVVCDNRLGSIRKYLNVFVFFDFFFSY